ncbi:hypothetical protein DFJ77DRAFT_513925 [Powellomyces hirtus]|nr:hypothetical protein DFJ77DRAFT_513925 [Powellomyces hirtus]
MTTAAPSPVRKKSIRYSGDLEMPLPFELSYLARPSTGFASNANRWFDEAKQNITVKTTTNDIDNNVITNTNGKTMRWSKPLPPLSQPRGSFPPSPRPPPPPPKPRNRQGLGEPQRSIPSNQTDPSAPILIWIRQQPRVLIWMLMGLTTFIALPLLLTSSPRPPVSASISSLFGFGVFTCVLGIMVAVASIIRHALASPTLRPPTTNTNSANSQQPPFWSWYVELAVGLVVTVCLCAFVARLGSGDHVWEWCLNECSNIWAVVILCGISFVCSAGLLAYRTVEYFRSTAPAVGVGQVK